jgi:hypothetical protein
MIVVPGARRETANPGFSAAQLRALVRSQRVRTE